MPRLQAKRANDQYQPKVLFRLHDEPRAANRFDACQARNLTAGALLADNVRRCTEILHAPTPDAEVAH